jgi:hypothetical protein
MITSFNQGVIIMLYRLFILDHDDNLITGVDLRSYSDEEALDWAGFVLSRGRIGELWCGTRRVGRAAPACDQPGGLGLACFRCEPAEDAAQAVFMFR